MTSKRDAIKVKLTIRGIGPIKTPMGPGNSARGINADTVVSTVATTGQATSDVPLTAA